MSSAETVSPKRRRGTNSAGSIASSPETSSPPQASSPPIEHGAIVVAEVAEKPPEALCAAERPVRDHEHPGADPGPGCGRGEALGAGKRMAALAERREVGEVLVHVEKRGAGHVAREVELPASLGRSELPAAVDELVAHGLTIVGDLRRRRVGSTTLACAADC